MSVHFVLTLIVDWLVPALCGGSCVMLGFVFKWGLALMGGVKALLRSDLNRIHREYVEDGIPVPLYVKDEADDIYAAYSALGGNGVGSELHEQILKAPVSKTASKV